MMPQSAVQNIDSKEKQILVQLWHDLNRAKFNGELLRQPDFSLANSSDYWGKFYPGGKKDRIAINRGFFQNKAKYSLAELIHTLLHEMSHQAQWEAGKELDHGPEFVSKMAGVGLDYETRTDL
jgi:predicted SprT family Zn-dependent metalloprotease